MSSGRLTGSDAVGIFNIIPTVKQDHVTAGVAKVRLVAASMRVECVIIKALADNAGTIYVGLYDTVTAANGYPLAKSEAVSFRIDDLYKIGLIASVDNQVAAWLSETF